jgi:hypothetical protein
MKNTSKKTSVSKVFGILSSVAVGMLVLTSASSAFAQDTKKEDTKDGYGYSFSDDPLAAGGFGPADATIRVRPGPRCSSRSRIFSRFKFCKLVL